MSTTHINPSFIHHNTDEDIEFIGPHGFVSLEHVGGSDLTIVNAARASFDAQSDWEAIAHDTASPGAIGFYLSERDHGLINFLMREGHTSPFEQVETWWRVRMPIFIVRQWVRHRMHEMNEESGRYSKLKNEFWTPTPEDIRQQTGKPGAYTFTEMDEETSKYAVERIHSQSQACLDTYHELLEMGVAKEIARTVLPLTQYTTFVWKQNLGALMHFLKLRNDSHAQREIREYAAAMEKMVTRHLPVSMRAWREKNARGEFEVGPRGDKGTV